MARGFIISFEGIDGCGKSVQSRLFFSHLKRQGRPVVLVKEPGDTEAGERIRKILLERGLSVSRWSELFLYLASRAQLVDEVIGPAVGRGQIVVCDRYVDSTVAYQCYGRGLPQTTVALLHRQFVGSYRPALTFLIDERPERLLGVLGRKVKDRIELESLDFQRAVRRGYLALAARQRRRVRVIKRSTIEATRRSIVREYEAFLNDTGRN